MSQYPKSKHSIVLYKRFVNYTKFDNITKKILSVIAKNTQIICRRSY